MNKYVTSSKQDKRLNTEYDKRVLGYQLELSAGKSKLLAWKQNIGVVCLHASNFESWTTDKQTLFFAFFQFDVVK